VTDRKKTTYEAVVRVTVYDLERTPEEVGKEIRRLLDVGGETRPEDLAVMGCWEVTVRE